jgi:hypothetical protein
MRVTNLREECGLAYSSTLESDAIYASETTLAYPRR